MKDMMGLRFERVRTHNGDLYEKNIDKITCVVSCTQKREERNLSTLILSADE